MKIIDITKSLYYEHTEVQIFAKQAIALCDPTYPFYSPRSFNAARSRLFDF